MAGEQNTTESMAYTAPKATFLVLFALAGLVGNIAIIISISCSKRLRTSALYLFTLNFALVNLIECAINVGIQLADVLTGTSLQISAAICKTNAFFVNVVWIEGGLIVTFLTLDRMMVFKRANSGRENVRKDVMKSPPRILVMIIYTWSQASLFSLPLALEIVPITLYNDINMCTISITASIVYVSTLVVCCFIAPILITSILFILTLRKIYNERAAMRAIMTRHQYSKDVDEPKYIKELNRTKFVGAVFMCWLFLVGPFIVSLFLNLYQYSEVNSEGLFASSDKSIVYMFFLWAKYLFVIILPISTFILKKELWQHFKDILCRKKNSAVGVANGNKLEDTDISTHDTIEKFDDEKKISREEKARESFIHNSGFHVPVLFATSNGVHIQTYGIEDELSGSFVMNDSTGLRGKKCDVLGSQVNLQQVEEDTSDYDSGNEIDPFSVSHPVSSKNLKDTKHDMLQKRSNSQPEVRNTKTRDLSDTKISVSVTVTSAADSGLDISSHAGNTQKSFGKTLPLLNLSRGDKQEDIERKNEINNSNVDRQIKESWSHNDTVDFSAQNEVIRQDMELSITPGVDNRAFSEEIEKCSTDKVQDSVAKETFLSSDSGHHIQQNDKGENKKRVKTKNVDSSLPPTPKKKKKQKKQKGSKGGNSSAPFCESEGKSEGLVEPPKPPARLLPLNKGNVQPLYRRMTDDVNEPSSRRSSISMEGKVNYDSDSVQNDNKDTTKFDESWSEKSQNAFHSTKIKSKKHIISSTKRRGTGDSQTSLLQESGSSADLKSLHDVCASYFGGEDTRIGNLKEVSDTVNDPQLEVTTPSACTVMMDISRELHEMNSAVPTTQVDVPVVQS